MQKTNEPTKQASPHLDVEVVGANPHVVLGIVNVIHVVHEGVVLGLRVQRGEVAAAGEALHLGVDPTEIHVVVLVVALGCYKFERIGTRRGA